MILPYLGESLSLITAVLWGIAVILFKKGGETAAPLALNGFKNALALVLFLLTMLVMGIPFFPDEVSTQDFWLIVISGALGIGLADTLFFECLNRLGAARTAVIETLYSPLVIGCSVLFLGDRLSWIEVSGAVLIVGGVLVGTTEGMGQERAQSVSTGILVGVLSMLLMASALILVKPILERADLLFVTFWRLAGGLVLIGGQLLMTPNRHAQLSTLGVRGQRRYLVLAAIVGTYLTLMTWMGGMKYASASVASVLNQTSTLFVFLFAALLLKEPVTRRRVLALASAVPGALLVTFG